MFPAKLIFLFIFVFVVLIAHFKFDNQPDYKALDSLNRQTYIQVDLPETSSASASYNLVSFQI